MGRAGLVMLAFATVLSGCGGAPSSAVQGAPDSQGAVDPPTDAAESPSSDGRAQTTIGHPESGAPDRDAALHDPTDTGSPSPPTPEAQAMAACQAYFGPTGNCQLYTCYSKNDAIAGYGSQACIIWAFGAPGAGLTSEGPVGTPQYCSCPDVTDAPACPGVAPVSGPCRWASFATDAGPG